MGACGEGETDRLGTKQATAGTDVACTRRGDSATGAIADAGGLSESGTPGGKTGVRKEGDWAGRLSDWGAVTISSEVVVPHKALEVSYHDISAAAPTKTTCREGVERCTFVLCLWVGFVHSWAKDDPSLVMWVTCFVYVFTY